MKTNVRNTFVFGQCMVLCLGLAWGCVKVDVTVTSPSTNRFAEPIYPHDKPPISIKKLKEFHAIGKKDCLLNFSRDINHEKQQTAAWCWAASSRMVMEYQNKMKVPPEPTALQCDIVRNVFSSWLGGISCCEIKISPDFINAPSACRHGGWPYWVFNKYQFNYEWVDGQFDDWEALKGEICKVGPFISVIEWSGGGRHAFIVRGYRETGLEKVVETDDPVKEDPEELTFDEFVGNSAMEDGSPEFSHDRTYVQISPETKS